MQMLKFVYANKELNMANENIYKGKWWIPGKENDKVSGVLSYTPEEAISLELIGNFEDSAKDAISSLFCDERVPVIYGQASDGSDISLFDCGNNINRVFKADFPIATYYPRVIAIGIHVSSLTEQRFFKAVVKIPELSHWLFPKSIEQKYYTDEDGISSINVKMDRLPESNRTAASTRLGNGATLSLTRDAAYNSGDLMFTTTFEQFTSLTIKSPRKLSLKWMYENAVRYERFLSIATLRDVAYSELTVFSKDSYKTIGKDKIVYNPIRIDTIFHDKPSDKKIETQNFLFNFTDVKDVYNEAIKKWFSKDPQFDAIRGHMLESIDYHGHFSYMNFLVVIQAIEGFGCRYKKAECELTKDARIAHAKATGKGDGRKIILLADIIKTLLNEYHNVACINKKLKIEAVVDSRNYYSHLTDKIKKNKLDGVKLFELTQDLRKLLLCCVLSYLGIPTPVINEYTKGCNNAFVRGYK